MVGIGVFPRTVYVVPPKTTKNKQTTTATTKTTTTGGGGVKVQNDGIHDTSSWK